MTKKDLFIEIWLNSFHLPVRWPDFFSLMREVSKCNFPFLPPSLCRLIFSLNQCKYISISNASHSICAVYKCEPLSFASYKKEEKKIGCARLNFLLRCKTVCYSPFPGVVCATQSNFSLPNQRSLSFAFQ